MEQKKIQGVSTEYVYETMLKCTRSVFNHKHKHNLSSIGKRGRIVYYDKEAVELYIKKLTIKENEFEIVG